MKDFRFGGKSELVLENIAFLMLSRNSGHTFEYKNGKKVSSLLFVEKGEMEYTFFKTGKVLTASARSLLFIPKNEPYFVRYRKDDTRIKILMFDARGTILSLPKDPLLKEETAAETIFSRITPEKARQSLLLSADLLSLLPLLEEKEKMPKKFEGILPALERISSRFWENKKVEEYAVLCRMSQTNFRRLFREYTGLSPIDYRNQIRLAEAEKKIQSGEFTVEEAARLSGFHNMSFFYELLARKEKR